MAEEIIDNTDLPVPAPGPGKLVVPLEGTVKYTGDATTRVITRADWNSIPAQHYGPVDDQDEVTWQSKVNDHTLPIDMFSDKALRYLEHDGKFKITDYSG